MVEFEIRRLYRILIAVLSEHFPGQHDRGQVVSLETDDDIDLFLLTKQHLSGSVEACLKDVQSLSRVRAVVISIQICTEIRVAIPSLPRITIRPATQC